MDALNTQYREVIEKVFQDYVDFLGNDEKVQVELVFDRERVGVASPKETRYLLVETGWENGYRIYGTLLQIDIIDNKLWIQQDGTEEGIALELVAAGIPISANCFEF